MPSPDASFTPHERVVAAKSEPQSQLRPPEPSPDWANRLLHRLSIRKKIGFGYALTLAVAIVGTAIGRTVGDYYYEDQSRENLERVHKETLVFNDLRFNVLEARNHQQQFISLISQPEVFREHYAHFIEHKAEVENRLSEIRALADRTNRRDLKQFLQNNQNPVESYFQQVESLLKKINELNLKTQDVSAAQQVLIAFTNNKVATEFDNFSEDVEILITNAHKAEEEAYEGLEEAEKVGTQVTIAAMLLSSAIATAIAIYTSRAIAHPIEAVTKVVTQANEEANFDLQAPVLTQDEVGVLAISFNTLIQRVANYTQELEFARQTLERRVAERTEELEGKNEQLEAVRAHLQELNAELVSQAGELSHTLHDLRQTQARLIQTEKMSSLGQMVAGVAHEINNPVNFIYGNLSHVSEYTQDLLALVDLYQQHYPNSAPEIQAQIQAFDLEFVADDLPKILSSMKMGTERIRQIVLSLRNFSRLDEADMKPVDIHEGIDSTLLILNHRLKRGIEVTKQYGELPLVECYPAQLNQVFMNILSNGIDALLEQSQQTSPQILIQTEIETENPGFVRVRIRDNGLGIPPDIQNKLFDPFFTTKPAGKGTGLGLAICAQIMEKHQGKIEVNSQPGKGTEFALVLPSKHPNAIALSSRLELEQANGRP
ncbi:ATP-binding protein [Trichocoleus sp. DQ-A3]|uniref:HAMP domain-containing sensor histidine kinase n=1 Tax=Cyanophyceae TaxID=3028117 RepID=UPI001689789F|nr:ATP-binding protein [Coleofasciculus sp. FACHB-125]MBD1898798.1 GHKL domain-containing protein [Coleofasciculus sp. FACHB-125]